MDKITSAQDLGLYNDDLNVRVFAGPGAGKTHLILENIKHTIQKSKKIKPHNKRKILCVTYTNAAVDTINGRLGAYSKYVVVSTIHSFINDYIIRPFQSQLRHIIETNFNIPIDNLSRISSVQEGFTVLSGHNKDDVYSFIQEMLPDSRSEEYQNLSRSKMSEIGLDISEINAYPYNSTYEVKLITKGAKEEIAWKIKEYIWRIAGKLTFDEILYFGLQLIEQFPIILYMLRAEFPYVIMDEYQDTNPIQNRILNIISEKEISVMVVGDVAQSIFSFQGATYHEFKDFKLKSPNPIVDKAIEGNRRSSENIISFINFIRQNDQMFEQKCQKKFYSKR